MKLILIAALAASLAAPGNDHSHHARSTQSATQSQPEPKHDTGPSLPVTVQNDIQRIARALEAANAKQESTRERERAEQDLRDQDNMAKWAFWMFLVGGGELLLTAIGVFLVWRTLLHTRDAAVAARDAVIETRSTGEAQTRAYLNIVKASVYFMQPRHHPVIEIQVLNYGLSPAYDFVWNPIVTYYAGDKLPLKKSYADCFDGDWEGVGGLDIAKDITIQDDLVISGHYLDDYTSPDLPVTISVEIQFRFVDVFGRRISGRAMFTGHPRYYETSLPNGRGNTNWISRLEKSEIPRDGG